MNYFKRKIFVLLFSFSVLVSADVMAVSFKCIGKKFPMSDFYSTLVDMKRPKGYGTNIVSDVKFEWVTEEHDGAYDLLETIGSHGCGELIDRHWVFGGFEKVHWNEGLGYEDACNINLPLNRTFRAMESFQRTTTNMSLDFTREAYTNFVTKKDHLRFDCTEEEVFGMHDFWDDIYLYPSSMNTSVVQLAGGLFHEARHYDEGHAWFNSCNWGGSCDDEWTDGGANAWEMLFWWDYGLNSVKKYSTKYLRQDGLNNARDTHENGFNNYPGLDIPVNAKW